MGVSNKKSIILLGVFGMLALFIRVVLFYLIFLGSWKFFLGKRQLTDNLKALYIIGPAVILTKIQPAWFDLHATAREAFVIDLSLAFIRFLVLFLGTRFYLRMEDTKYLGGGGERVPWIVAGKISVTATLADFIIVTALVNILILWFFV